MNGTITPENESQVAELLRWAAAERQGIALAGAGTKTGFGVEAAGDCKVSLSGISGILEYEPEELVMRALPGTPLEEVRHELSVRHQHLAFEPPGLAGVCGATGSSAGTIGGAFMANASGPRRFRAGAARDHILGLRAVNGRGESWKSGGRVIKNVTGYDLSKLLAGSWGTLSVVTEVTFKVLPAPPASATIAVTGLDAAAGLELVRELAASPFDATGLAYLPQAALTGLPPGLRTSREDLGIAFVRVEGSPLSVEDRLRAFQQLGAATGSARRLKGDESTALWDAVREVQPLHDAEVIVKVSLPPAWALEAVSQLSTRCHWFADGGAAWLWLGIPAAMAASVISGLRSRFAGRGSCVVWRAPEEIKREVGVFSPVSESMRALAARLKQSFDPQNLLNPGRLGLA